MVEREKGGAELTNIISHPTLLFVLLLLVSVIYLLIGCSLLVAVLFLGLFLWAVRAGQYEDDVTPSVRMLVEPNKKDTGIDHGEV